MAQISVDQKVPGGMKHRFDAPTRARVAQWLVDAGLYPVITTVPGGYLEVTGRGWAVRDFAINRFVETLLPEVVPRKRALFTDQLVRTFASGGQTADQVPRLAVLWDSVAVQEAAADWPRTLGKSLTMKPRTSSPLRRPRQDVVRPG